MSTLEELVPKSTVKGIIPDHTVTIVDSLWHGTQAVEVTYRMPSGNVDSILLYRTDEQRIDVVKQGRPWSFDGEGDIFRLVSEARRISLAHLFDPLLAVHTSLVEPLPHQITAVYETMLPRQPLRFLLADDPGAGKTIMAGLLMKELIARGDLERCLVVCPGSLAEQWQDELYRRFNLPFEILTNDKLEGARTGNWFKENDLVIARLDKLSRNDSVKEKLSDRDCTWDLVVCDEAHKMSASFFGNEIKYTKRYQLGQLLSSKTRNFLLMTATPHNGKEEDFQLFLALLDGDRFEGKFRDGVHHVDVTDLMRRMVKENLYKFDGTPLFPERHATTKPYQLSGPEARLYTAVTDYVREEYNRADALQNKKRAGTIGFALTILQRRLASSPEAIATSLSNRRKRLESRLSETLLYQKGTCSEDAFSIPDYDLEDLEDYEEMPESERSEAEEEILDQATASRTVEELQAEIQTLKTLEAMADSVRNNGDDTKWRELASLLESELLPHPERKLVIFTEHRDTLRYLKQRITTLFGRQDALVTIHGSMGREDRLKAQELFRYDPRVQILLATDAAGEGINLQRSNLMVNYDLPWNPNRIEQRFGRIHRIGQAEVCYLWNLVAIETREGDVYRTLLDKLERAREALGGKVFDVLGKLQFDGKPLRDLLVDAIRYGEDPVVRARLTTAVEGAFEQGHIQQLLDERVLAHETMDTSRIQKVREDMERADARRLQPHYIESFFLEAFRRLGGTVMRRESGRYEVTRVPASVLARSRLIGTTEPVLQRYERITFEKERIAPPGIPPASFVCPGHPLLDSTIDLTLERHHDVLRRGTVLVDETDAGTTPRVLFYLEHALRDACTTRTGEYRTISKKMLYVSVDEAGVARHHLYAPYLDYRPLAPEEPSLDELLSLPECRWINLALEERVMEFAITDVVPEHLFEVRGRRLAHIIKTQEQVHARLTKEIAHWDRRYQELKEKESAGKSTMRLSSSEAKRKADELAARMEKRMAELEREKNISSRPPVVVGGALIIPQGLLAKMEGADTATLGTTGDTDAAGARAREIVMDVERSMGFNPIDREYEKLGYDIESRVPHTGKLRFIEVKGRVSGAQTVTVTKNEILFSLNKPEDYILAIVEFMVDGSHSVHYLREPFRREPDFGVTSVNYNFSDLLARSTSPA